MMAYRSIAFCALLAALWIPCVCILVQVSDFAGLGDWVPGKFFAVAIARSAPFVAKDASLFGELTPVAVAAGLTVLAPRKTELTLIYTAVIVALIGWALYLVLSVLTEEGPFYQALQTLMEGEPGAKLSALTGFVTSTRVFYLVVGATLIGVRIRKDVTP
jgi:hypothetical protein